MISVVMPVYNTEKYVREAIRSVVEQTYKDWELLLINDCSTDGSLQMIEEELQTLEGTVSARIRVINNEKNSGPAFTRNRGIEESGGEWIAFLDSDDRWAPDKLEKQMACAEENGCSFIFTGSGFLNEEGRILRGYLAVPHNISYNKLLKQNLVSCSSVLIRREVLFACKDENGEIFPDTRRRNLCMHEDFPLWLSCLQRTGTACGVNEPLLYYRMQSASQSGDKRKAARMTYEVYCFIGLPLPLRLWFFAQYAVRSLKKYAGIA